MGAFWLVVLGFHKTRIPLFADAIMRSHLSGMTPAPYLFSLARSISSVNGLEESGTVVFVSR